VVVRTDAEWLARWALGEVSLGQGMKARRVEAIGPRHLVRTLARWGTDGARAAGSWGVTASAAVSSTPA
jgi:hypothetical protein